MKYRFSFPILLSIFFFSCITIKPSHTVNSLDFIGEFELPHRQEFDSTVIGGLSGIDYDTRRGVYYLICDDGSDISPARFYTAKIYLSDNAIDSIGFLAVTRMLQKSGKAYPSHKADPFNAPDPEAIRYNPIDDNLVWSSEGERINRSNDAILTNPSVNLIKLNGQFIDSFSIPANLYMHASEQGPRRNGVLEGLTFTNNYKKLFVSVEEPLYQDGHRAGNGDSAGIVRILKFDVSNRKAEAQYAYQIDAVVKPSVPPGQFKVNGITDILAINDNQLLVTERSFSTGQQGSNIRVYMAELNGADDIGTTALYGKLPAHPVQKKLLVDMDKLGIFIDNIEGATFGPLLPGGKRSLIFVADDNFAATEKTQFLLFRIN
jgi:hypothetical protein